MSKALCRKAINFDLDTKALKKYYPGKNYRDAYSDIKKFMEKSGFEHRQWSGYISLKKLSINNVFSLSQKISKAFPWLSKCVNRFDVTDIGEQHDLTHLITGQCKEKVKVVQKENAKSKGSKPLFSAKQLKERANQISRQPHRQDTKNISKDMER